jgi:hypothetical protein
MSPAEHPAGPTARRPTRRYRDPLDEVWLAAARRLGLRVVRRDDAYAATDGRGTLVVGTPRTLDADDGLAQMIFHEICHWLVEGDEAAERPDWGLDNVTDRDVPREHATLRLQAALAQRHGLRAVLAPTTDFRAYHDALPADPLEPRDDPASIAARLGLQRADREPWHPVVAEALAATGRIVREAASFAGRERDADPDAAPSLLLDVEALPPPHPTGLAPSPLPGRRCGACAWSHEAGPVLRCRQADEQRVEAEWAGCERFEAELDCRRCAACCRHAYQSVTVPPGDPVLEAHPELIVRCESWVEIARDGDRCAALEGGGAEAFACRIYEERPRPCAEFELGGEHCATARRRVGLSA